jgi:hypothetical protein
VAERQHRIKNRFSTALEVDESLFSYWHTPSKDVSKFIKKEITGVNRGIVQNENDQNGIFARGFDVGYWQLRPGR